MPIGQADLDNAVREGWIRDEDNELSIDGYNSTIQITTNDGTSGFDVKNSTGAVSFSAKSDGDGYFAKKLGVGTFNPETELEVIGKARVDQLQVTSGAVSGYTLTSDADGNATWQPISGSDSVSETTFQENKNAQNEINHQILSSLDGYAQNSTVTEHYQQFSQAIQDIVSVIDGYSTDAEFAGLTTTVEEHKNSQAQINQSVLQSLDGYAIRFIEDQRWIDSSQQLQDLRNSLDGYVINQTFEENKNAQSEINNQILISIDGYASKVTESEHYTQLSQAIQDIVGIIDGYSTDTEFAGLTNTELEHTQQQNQVNQTILQTLDGYAYVPNTNAISDGYVAFFIDSGKQLAGDNDLYFDRVNNQLQISALKLTTAPFDGYVLITDDSGNATWQKRFFGTNYVQVSEDAETGTTSSSFQNKLTLSLSNIPFGKYRIGWYHEYRQGTANRNFQSRVQLDGSIVLAELTDRLPSNSSDQSYTNGGFAEVNLFGSHIITLDYAVGGNSSGGSGYIKNAKLQVWRVEE